LPSWGLHLDDLAWESHRYWGSKSYGAAKMAQLLSMIKLHESFEGTSVTVNAMHPGNVRTNSGQSNGAVYRFLKRILVDSTAKSPEVAAEALYYLGVSGDVKHHVRQVFQPHDRRGTRTAGPGPGGSGRAVDTKPTTGWDRMTTESKTIVIAGAGMAGLTAAAYLARDGHRVLLLDRNDKVGGLVRTFDVDGFSFDGGPRAFLNSGIVRPILGDLGISWDYVDNRITVGIEDQLIHVESMDSLRDYEGMLRVLYPDSIEDIAKVVAMVAKLSAYTEVLYGFDNPNFGDVMSDKKFVIRKLLPWTVKFLRSLRKMSRYGEPMEDFLARLTGNQSLIDISTQHFFRRTPTYFALGYFYGYLDYFYPRGGTGALVHLLEEKLLSSGVEIGLNRQIVEVTPAASTVTDAEGNSYHYDDLIWAADLKTLYRSLNTTGLDQETVGRIEAQTRSVLSAKGAESSFVVFIAADRPPSYFRTRGGEHMFYTPSRQGLGETHRSELQALVEAFDAKSKDDVLDWLDAYCRLNTYEVSIPVLRDPALAPENQTGLMISFLLDYGLVERIKNAGWYDEFKAILEDRIIKLFSQTIYHGLEDDILFHFSSTPLTIREVAGSSEGAITGWSFETDIPVVSKLTEIPKSVLTPMPNVLQAGQWAYCPAGVPTAMLTGWYATRVIAKRSKR
jgi:phytoene dehydrogenase-like protein